MSLQVQPLPQQQQPVQVYPTSVTYESPPHHSNGSFGSVFVVLAIIIVISAVACCLGRLCNRRSNSHSHNQKPVKQQKQQNRQFHPKEVDIEFGFDKRIAASKPNGHAPVRGHKPLPHGDMKSFETSKPNGHGPVRGHKPLPHGDMKSFEMKLGPQGKLRGGA